MPTSVEGVDSQAVRMSDEGLRPARVSLWGPAGHVGLISLAGLGQPRAQMWTCPRVAT